MNILGMGPLEVLVVLVLAVLILGPERMISMARTVGKLSRDLAKTNESVRRTFQDLLEDPAEALTRGSAPEAPPDDRVRAHPEAQPRPRRRSPPRDAEPPDAETPAAERSDDAG